MRTNRKLRFGDFFSAFACPYLCRLVLLSTWLATGVLLGSVLFILPGVYFALATSFALPLHLQHKGMGAIDSISISMQALNGNLCSFLGFTLLGGVINTAGAHTHTHTHTHHSNTILKRF
jgi:uncharacterized membrane protein